MFFDEVQGGPPDVMYDLKVRADRDAHAEKVDLGVGIYRNGEGLYQELDCIKEAKRVLAKNDPGHDYEVTVGNAEFLDIASKVMFGDDCQRLNSKQIASVQSISGTGAVHLAALFISRCIAPCPEIYVGSPTWGNYKPAFNLVGLDIQEYSYYNRKEQAFDLSSSLDAIRTAPPSSVFIFQGCCHNPTAQDPTTAQWDELILALRAGKHLPVFDIAYQGLGNGLDRDAYAIRQCANLGLEMLVCQSFSKNFALYGERCGALHVACGDADAAARVKDRIRSLIRWEFSSSPAYGSRLVRSVLKSPDLTDAWYLQLSPEQCEELVDTHHVHMPKNGRINVSGLNERNIERVARAIDEVVRKARVGEGVVDQGSM
ncbi:hypothetical protein ACCO45_008703 [Purpureocillium lilacinum]|uniref:Uncharacterized protein n=1 Tax=Purpureocillium lilacinum TaxID=33203 RepID=A0ACC4DNZ4_PURLI